jgi:hypothetical protein
MEDIVGIGETLFACGDGGQIYQRRASGEWINVAPELLQEPGTSAMEYDMFNCVNGPAEDDVYVVGRFGKIFHWDGARISPVISPTQNGLVSIYVEEPRSIWISGANGTLLNGNHRDGFRRVLGIGAQHHLNSVTMHQGTLYLGSAVGWESGLYTYESGRFSKVETGLKPGIAEVNHVDVGDGLLWAVGLKDIIRFDGKTWERIDFPLNPPIR